ncbi:putative sulfate/molybdate transporter [Halovivax gelatinilyticus]|uniref:putative sulfate/molybdate transporter n=1 Tax=Halovivax gelatinilyticus TaxID=2961597 RepID=UPI0020CA5F4B|nr:putative sulfate/molybdate transporter [Halovivax gelatinilyticus]
MAVSTGSENRRGLEFSAGAFTGAIGDTITVLPLVIGLALLTEISLPHVLLAFGAFQLVWGVVYGLPVSVEPMKALAALAIAGALTYAELALAGLILGAVLLAVGAAGVLAAVERWIGEPVVRGVQFAVGLLLIETGVDLAISELWLAAASAAIVLAFVALGAREASGLVVLAVAFAIALWSTGLPTPQWPGQPPTPAYGEAVTRATLEGTLAQLAMTVGNAALATSLLFADRFDAEVSPDALSVSMGTTNLLAIPAGGIPMCHGCDGVAGKHAFGARTGGANVVAGIGYLAGAFVLTGALVAAFPLAMLGVLLVLVGISLGTSVMQSSMLWLSVAIGIASLLVNLGVAFLAGVVVYLLVRRSRRGV